MREHGIWQADSLPKHLKSTTSRLHVIRLHGPWQCELYTSPAALPRSDSEASRGWATETLKIKVPVDWSAFLSERICGPMVWRRSFGRPTNLGPHERVELVISDLRADVLVWLNEVQISRIVRPGALARFEVTNRLEVRNQLALEVHTPPLQCQTAHPVGELNEQATAGPFEQVYLEIFTGE